MPTPEFCVSDTLSYVFEVRGKQLDTMVKLGDSAFVSGKAQEQD